MNEDMSLSKKINDAADNHNDNALKNVLWDVADAVNTVALEVRAWS